MLDAAYARIETIAIEQPLASDAFLTVRVNVFANTTAKKDGKRPVAIINFEATGSLYNAFINACVNGGNPVTIVYNYLKTLPLFSGAIDV